MDRDAIRNYSGPPSCSAIPDSALFAQTQRNIWADSSDRRPRAESGDSGIRYVELHGGSDLLYGLSWTSHRDRSLHSGQDYVAPIYDTSGSRRAVGKAKQAPYTVYGFDAEAGKQVKYSKILGEKPSMSMMNIVREVYQEASDTFRTLVRVSKTTPTLLRNLKEFREGCKEYLKNRELTISVIPVDKYLDYIPQNSVAVLEKNNRALICLLRFTLNLCTDPTREEYFIIKRYTAYFQCNIDGLFSFTDDLLASIGYKPNPEADEYCLERIPENIVEIAFNLFLTTIEFERVIEFAIDAEKEGFSVSDCLQARKEINESMSGWTSIAGLKWLKEKESLEKKSVQRELDDGFSKSNEAERLKFGGSQYGTSDTSSYHYSQDGGGDSYKYVDKSSTRDSALKFPADMQERSWGDTNRSYSQMRGKEQFFSTDRRASDNNYQGSTDNYKGSMFLDNRNDISDHELYGDSHDSIGNESKDRSISPSNSLSQTGGRMTTDLKGVDIYNSGQYCRTSDKQQYLGLSDDRPRDTEAVEKLTSATSYTLDKPGREFLLDSESRTSAMLPSKDTVTPRVPSDRLTTRVTSAGLQRTREISNEVITESQSTPAFLLSDKAKDVVPPYDTSNCDSSSGKSNLRAYDQGAMKKSDRSSSSYGKTSESSLYGQSVTGQRFLQSEVLSDVTREPGSYRSAQTRGKTEICARGVNDFTNLVLPNIYKS